MDMSIRFPNLNISLDYVPKGFQVFGVEFSVFGILVALGMLLGIFFIVLEAKRTNQNQNQYLGMVIFAIVGGVIGARLYYVGFQWNLYKSNAEEILNLRNGGMAFYGALLGGTLFAALFCQIRKISFWKMADTAVTGLLVGQIAGSLGCFFSREGFGEYTDNVLAMQLPLSAVRSGDVTAGLREHLAEINGVSYIQAHPLFLYNCLWCILILIFILAIRRKKRFQGELFMHYLTGYGLGHIVIEWLRTDKLYIPATKIPVSVLVSVVLAVYFGITVTVQRIMAKKRAEARKRRKERFYEEEQKMREQAEEEEKRSREAMEKWKQAHTAKGEKEKTREALEREKRARAALEEREKFREAIQSQKAQEAEAGDSPKEPEKQDNGEQSQKTEE